MTTELSSRKLTLDDIADARAYERERTELRARVIDLKSRRRVSLGTVVTLMFENRDTMRYQIQEMARVERTFTDPVQGGVIVPSYTAAKSGIAGLTRALANEWAKYRINVNAIAPGYMATDNTAALRADANRSVSILDRIPAGRWGEPSDLRGAAVFLASAASDYLYGSIVPVDGGWMAR